MNKQQRGKWKNRILIALAHAAGITWIVCACLVDVIGPVGDAALCGVAVSTAWLGLFGYANEWFERRE